MMKALLIFPLYMSMLLCLFFQRASSPTDESILIKKVFGLKEVQQEQQHLHRLLGKKANISIYISAHPTVKAPYYFLQVGYVNSVRFEVYDNYRIDKKFIFKTPIANYIEVLDTAGRYTNLSAFRKYRRNTE